MREGVIEYKRKPRKQHKNKVGTLTFRMAIVPLQQNKIPAENSEDMLFFAKTCLNSESFSSFIKTGSCLSSSVLGSSVKIFSSSSSTASKIQNVHKILRAEEIITFHRFIVDI